MNKKFLTIIIVLFFLIFLTFVLIRNKNDLKRNGIFTNGKIINVYRGSKGGINVEYEFFINNFVVSGSEFYFINNKFINKFKFKTFPVIYSKKDPLRNRMLITKKDFSDFNIPYPDSLNWVINLEGL